MTNDQDKRIAQLIQQAMNTGMPSDLEQRMERQMDSFFADKSEETSTSVPDFTFLKPWFDWMSRPAVSYAFTATVFVCMILSSLFMHLSDHKNALATSIDTIHLTAKVFTAIENAESMIVDEQIIEGEDGAVTNKIHWSDGVSRIVFGGDEPVKETWIITESSTEIHHPGKEGTVIKPLHETAALFATPERLINQLMGKWKVTQIKPDDTVQNIEVTIENMREGYQIKLWVNPITNLPKRIETNAAERPGGGTLEWKKIEMNLNWNQPVDLE